MKVSHWNVYFFLAILLLVGYMAFLVLQPFMTAMLVAAVLAVLFFPMYQRTLSWVKEYQGLSASVVLTVVVLLIIIPVVVLSFAALTEANRLYELIDSERVSWAAANVWADGVNSSALWMRIAGGQTVQEVLGLDAILSSLRNVSGSLVVFLEALYQGVADFLFWMFAMFFALFYFLIDGKQALRFIMRISPLRDEHERILIREFVSMSRATIKGTLVVAFVQGLFGGLAFAIAGVSSPVLWGLIMGFLSLIPVLGAGLVWFPVAVFLLVTGQIWQGVFMMAFGFGVVSTIDNLLRPKLVGQDTQIHPLLVLFATLGGLSLFGFVGFLIGPIIVALFMSLVKIYEIEFKSQLDQFNR